MIKGQCELCKRNDLELTRHHLVPREEGGTSDDIVLLCKPCHMTIHSFYDNKELAIRLNTIKSLLDDLNIKKYIKWIKKQPNKSKIKIKKPNNRRHKR